MDTEFKPLLIVNVPSGLTPSSSIASAPFCVCVCPMCTCALKCVCVACVCEGGRRRGYRNETKTAIYLSHSKISKEDGKHLTLEYSKTTAHLHLLKPKCKCTTCHPPSDKAAGVKEGSAPCGTVVIAVGNGDPCKSNFVECPLTSCRAAKNISNIL